jgi:hypothetical protein
MTPIVSADVTTIPGTEAPTLEYCNVDAGAVGASAMGAAGVVTYCRVSWGHNKPCERQTDREGRHGGRLRQ